MLFLSFLMTESLKQALKEYGLFIQIFKNCFFL